MRLLAATVGAILLSGHTTSSALFAQTAGAAPRKPPTAPINPNPPRPLPGKLPPPKLPLPPAPPPPVPPTDGSTPTIGGFPAFPNSIFNKDISNLPVASYSAAIINSVGTSRLHADFGTMWDGKQNGIPFNINGTIPANVSFEYADESDPGPYLFNSVPNIEGTPKAGDQPNLSDGGDHHCLTVGNDGKLYELYNARKLANGSWQAASGSIWTLSSNKMRPATWTSADAAGLPMVPLLVKYSEVQSGTISHALRFTLSRTANKYVWPASHQAGVNNQSYPAMGVRFRLKSSFNTSAFPQEVKVILAALKKYGMILADNGSNGYISGEPNPNWSDDHLAAIGSVRLSDFEIVEESALQAAPNSYQSN